MINEYIEKAQIAINEYLKSVKKGSNERVFLNVVEKYFNDIYDYIDVHINTVSDSDLARVHGLENSLHSFIVSFDTELSAPYEALDQNDYLLKTIVYFARKQLYKKDSVDFSSDSLRKNDLQATKYVADMCDRLGVLCYTINIKKIFGIPKDHNISVIKIDDNYYFVDLTYQQYFLLGQNFKNRLIRSANNIVKCEVGSRMLYLNHGGTIELLEKGYISFDDEIFDDYFNTMFEQYDKEPLTHEEYMEALVKNKKIR